MPTASGGVLGFGSALRRYFVVLGALLRVEEKRRRAAPMEAILELLEPVLLMTIMTTAWWFLARRNSSPLGGPPALFYATGFFSLYFFTYLSNRMRRFIPSSSKRFPIERRLDHMIVHAALKTLDYTILGIFVFGVIYLFFTPQAVPYDFLYLFQACILIIMLGFGWGAVNLVMARMWSFWLFLLPAINRSLIVFSGVFFLVEFIPPAARGWLSYNPVLHAIAAFRRAFYPNYPTLVLDMNYLFYCAVFAVALGLALERVTRRLET
jgi:capsular polysaccharide transport system permease protein